MNIKDFETKVPWDERVEFIANHSSYVYISEDDIKDFPEKGPLEQRMLKFIHNCQSLDFIWRERDGRL